MAPLPFEQVVFETIKSLCQSLGFDYHILLVSVKNPAERHWAASDSLSSLRVVSDFSKGSHVSDVSPSSNEFLPEEPEAWDETDYGYAHSTDILDDDGERDSWQTLVKHEASNDDSLLGDVSLPADDFIDGGKRSVAPRNQKHCLTKKRQLINGSPDKTRKRFSLARKLQILDFINAGNRQTEASKHFGLSRTTVTSIWKDRNQVMEAARNSVNLNRKASAESPYAPIEKPLLNWYLGLRRVNQTVTGAMIQDEALKIAEKLEIIEFTASRGWLSRFQEKYNIRLKDQMTLSSHEKAVN